MEEEYPSFDLNFEFLEQHVEEENKTYSLRHKEVEEFIKEQRVTYDKFVMQCFLVVYREHPTPLESIA